IALLTQFIIFIFLLSKDNTVLVVLLGMLLGCGLNFLILGAMGFTAVVRNRPVRKFVMRAVIIAIIAPVLSGAFIASGVVSPGSPHLIAYLVLVVSNLYLMRQLGRIDAKEQVEVAPVLWRPAVARSEARRGGEE